MNLKETLAYLVDLVKAGDNPTPHRVELGGRKALLFVKGESTEIETERGVLVREVIELQSLAHLVGLHGRAEPVCYVNETGITTVLDDDDRRERITMPFDHSRAWLDLEALEHGIDQRGLLRLLDSTLHGVIQHNEFRTIISNITWEKRAVSTGGQSHTTDTMGRQVDRAASTAGELPRSVTVCLDVFSTPADVATACSYQMAVLLDHDNERIALVPVGDPLPAIILGNIQKIADALTKMLEETHDGRGSVVLGSVRD